MKGVLTVLVCLLALQTSTGVNARFLLDLRSLPLHGRHLTIDYRGEDPIGADTRGKDPIGADTRGSDPIGGGTHGASSSAQSLASLQPSASQAPAVAPTVAIAQAPAFAARPTTTIAQAPAFAARPTTTIAQAPAFAATSQVTAPAAAMPQEPSATLQAQSQGDAPASAPAGESAPSAPAVPTLESVLGRRLAEDDQSEGTGVSTGAARSHLYSHSIFKQQREAPTSAQSSSGGPIPLSSILFTEVPRPGKPTLATAPATAPGGTEAPTASE